jgi:hypothetical protein
MGIVPASAANSEERAVAWGQQFIWLALAILAIAGVVGITVFFNFAIYLVLVTGALPMLWVVLRICTKDILYLVIILAAYIPFEGIILKWLPGSLQVLGRFAPEIIIALSLIWVMLRYWQRHRRFVWPANILDGMLVLFLCLAILSTVANQVPIFITLLALKNLIRYIGLYYVILCSSTNVRFLQRFSTVMIVVASIQAGLAIVETIGGLRVAMFLRPSVTGYELLSGVENLTAGFANAKPSGTIGIYSSFGAFLVFWACFLFTKLLVNRRPHDVVLLGLVTAGVFLSRSRTSWIMLVIVLGLAFLFTRKQLLGKTLLFGFPIAGLFCLLLVISDVNLLGANTPQLTDWNTLIVDTVSDRLVARPESIVQRLTEVFSPDYWRTSSRLNTFLVTAPELLRRYPLLGVGPGTLGSEVTGGGSTSVGIYPQFSHEHWLDVPRSIVIWTADSGWIAILAQYGIVALLAWWGFFTLLFQTAYRLYRNPHAGHLKWFSAGMMANIIVLFWSIFSVHYLTYRAVSIYFWICAAFLVVLQKQLAWKPEPLSLSLAHAQASGDD